MTQETNKYTKADLEKLLATIPFQELVQVGDIVTNRNALVLRDLVIEKGVDTEYNPMFMEVEETPYFICEKSGKWTGTTPGWVLEANPIKKKDEE
jgi:hypothetical protein